MGSTSAGFQEAFLSDEQRDVSKEMSQKRCLKRDVSKEMSQKRCLKMTFLSDEQSYVISAAL